MTVAHEQNVIGAVLIDPASYFRAADLVTPADFSETLHANLWRAFGTMHAANEAIDAFTVAEVIGGDSWAYTQTLASTTPGATSIRAYAEGVKASANKRRGKAIGERLANNGDLTEAQTKIEEVLSDQPGRLITAEQANKAMFEGVMARYERQDEYAGVLTGIPQLDDLTGGLQDGRVYALGARAKMGKSILAWQIAAHVAVELGKPVVGFSLEMGADELMQRMACAIGGIRSVGLLRPKLLRDDEWSRLNVAIGRLNKAPLRLSERMDVTIVHIEAQCRQAKPRLIVIDYLQLIEQPKLETEAVRLAYITRRVKKLAKDCNCPVIEVFQVNRGSESNQNPGPPMPSNARGSGTIEQDCDAMLLLHRPSYYDKTAEKGLRLDLALQRNGPTGIIHMDDDLEKCRFTPTDRQYVEPRREEVDL